MIIDVIALMSGSPRTASAKGLACLWHWPNQEVPMIGLTLRVFLASNHGVWVDFCSEYNC